MQLSVDGRCQGCKVCRRTQHRVEYFQHRLCSTVQNILTCSRVAYDWVLFALPGAVHYLNKTCTHFRSNLTDGRFRVKDVTSKNECLTRLETCDIADIKRELALTKHQIQIEQKVHSTASDYLKDLQANLAQELVNWTQRTDDSILNKDKEIQVS